MFDTLRGTKCQLLLVLYTARFVRRRKSAAGSGRIINYNTQNTAAVAAAVQEVKGLKINIKRKKEERQEREQATGDILQVVQERK